MKIYKNKYASRPYYFVRTGSKLKSYKNESRASEGYIIQLWAGKWICEKDGIYNNEAGKPTVLTVGVCQDSSIKNDFICVVDNKESANDFIENAIIKAVLNLIPEEKMEGKRE